MSALFPQLLLDVHPELIIDLFAGGGGASLGIEMATGRSPDAAVNHDEDCIELHKLNHPQTRHFHADVFEVDPRDVTQGRPIGLLWASPDCTDHSKAKGGKPIRDRKRRALAWVVKRWAGQVRPRVILLENVEEFVEWGPLIGLLGAFRRDPKRKGQTFRRFVRDLEGLGYAVEHRELKACDYGAPTTRRRLFMVARCDGQPIVWPDPTHGPGRLPYRTAAECIDWSIPMLSIFATKEEAKAWGKAHGQRAPKRPLAAATMRRIARGLKRFVLDAARPFLVTLNHGGGRDHAPRGLDDPMRTVTATRDAHGLVAPVLASVAHGDSGGRREYSVEEPVGTVQPGGQKYALVAPYLVPRYGEREGQEPRALKANAPLPAIVPTANGGSLVAASLVTYYGDHAEPRESDARGAALDEPLRTQSTENRHALVTAFLAKHYGGHETPGAAVDRPIGTVTTQDHHHLVAASLAKLRGTSSDADPAAPLHTVSAGGTHHGVVAAHLEALYTARGEECRAAGVDEPLRTVTATPRHAVVAAFVSKFYGQGTGTDLGEPAPTVTTKDRLGLVTVTLAGVLYVVVDIAMRMLRARELFRAQSFPDSYVIDRGADGRKFSGTKQVEFVGNSVPPVVACALAAANAPELVARDEAAA